MGKWTRFMDMHSGGGTKEQGYEYIYIEAPQEEAEVVFYNRFGHSPSRVSCTCCGDDYSVTERAGELSEVTAFERNCDYAYFDTKGREVPLEKAWVRGRGMKKGYACGYVERSRYDFLDVIPLDEWLNRGDVLVIYSNDIQPHERVGSVPIQGYQWVE